MQIKTEDIAQTYLQPNYCNGVFGNLHSDWKIPPCSLLTKTTCLLWTWSWGNRGRMILFQILQLIKSLATNIPSGMDENTAKADSICQAKLKWKQNTLPLKQTKKLNCYPVIFCWSLERCDFYFVFQVVSGALLMENRIYKTKKFLKNCPKLYTPSTLNIVFILWHTQLNVCAVK